jgi:predicted RNase H-related nuclease YkuK (DUF458 family)
MTKEEFYNELPNIKSYIENSPEDTMVYLGCDSQHEKKPKNKKGKDYKKKVRYAIVVVVHTKIGGTGKGAKIFGYTEKVNLEDVKDADKSRPFNKLFLEVQKIAEVFDVLADVLIERDFEIHLDINSKESEGSNIAAKTAVGYILGTIGVEPVLKPHSFAASFGADRFAKEKSKFDNFSLPKFEEEVE